MIINSFDDKSPSKVNPKPKENRLKCAIMFVKKIVICINGEKI